jgi:hypothetical protein
MSATELLTIITFEAPISRAGHSLLFTLFANRYSATFLNFAVRYTLFATSFDKSDGLYSSRLFKFLISKLNFLGHFISLCF